MNSFREAFDAFCDLVLNAQDVFPVVVIGSLPPKDSLCAAISAGSGVNTDIGHASDIDVDVVVNAKHKNHRYVVDALTDVHYMLSRMTQLPKGEGWQILSIETSSFPTYIEHDGDQFLYGSAFRVLISLD